MTAPTPTPNSDLSQAFVDFNQHGLCVIPAVLVDDDLVRARDAMYVGAQQDTESGARLDNFALDPDNANQRVWNLLIRDPIFAHLACGSG